MIDGVRVAGRTAAGSALGGSAVIAGATAASGFPGAAGVTVGVGGIVVSVVWLIARLVREFFWLRALNRPAAIAERVVQWSRSEREARWVLGRVLAAQGELVTARRIIERRSQ